jgi:propanol-preferring alcohol dehydrogenase
MHAMVLDAPGTPLRWAELPERWPGPGEIRVAVSACGVCRTDLHVVDGELPHPALPIIPGHEVVGRVDALGAGVTGLRVGERVGLPWLGHTCGHCAYCAGEQENLCDAPLFHGYTRDGGYASAMIADARFAFPLGEPGASRGAASGRRTVASSGEMGVAASGAAAVASSSDVHDDDAALAPLLCAGLIGWRALRLAGPGRRLGLYGFGAAAHLLAQVARWQGRTVYAFTRPGDTASQRFALGLGAEWAGGADEPPPQPLDAAILFAPSGALVPQALRAVRKGGRVVCAGIHMSDIPSFPYRLLWEERQIVSVANLTRQDGLEFLALAPRIGLVTHVVRYPLARANEALADLRAGRFDGAAVLVP